MKKVVNISTIALLVFIFGLSGPISSSASREASFTLLGSPDILVGNNKNTYNLCQITVNGRADVLLMTAVVVATPYIATFALGVANTYLNSRHDAMGMRCHGDCRMLKNSSGGKSIYFTEECVCYNTTEVNASSYTPSDPPIIYKNITEMGLDIDLNQLGVEE
jgi:hypothetical protein